MEWSKEWNASKKPGKQRKYRLKAPTKIRHGFLSAHLSAELRKKYAKRNTIVVKGDKVKILRGQFSGHEGKVEEVSLQKTKVRIADILLTKKDGSKRPYYIDPSNCIITELNMDDKKRNIAISAKKG